MTPTEAATLCNYIQAAAPEQDMDEIAPTIWAVVLEDVSLPDAEQAARTLLARQQSVTPAEIIAETERAITSARIMAHLENRDPDLDNPFLQLMATIESLGEGVTVILSPDAIKRAGNTRALTVWTNDDGNICLRLDDRPVSS